MEQDYQRDVENSIRQTILVLQKCVDEQCALLERIRRPLALPPSPLFEGASVQRDEVAY